MSDETEWELEHWIGGTFGQFEARWEPSSQDPNRMVRVKRMTGKACYICNCGVVTGWVDRDTLPLPSEWIYAHMSDEDKERWLENIEGVE